MILKYAHIWLYQGEKDTFLVIFQVCDCISHKIICRKIWFRYNIQSMSSTVGILNFINLSEIKVCFWVVWTWSLFRLLCVFCKIREFFYFFPLTGGLWITIYSEVPLQMKQHHKFDLSILYSFHEIHVEIWYQNLGW